MQNEVIEVLLQFAFERDREFCFFLEKELFECCLLLNWERELLTVVSCLTGFRIFLDTMTLCLYSKWVQELL